MVLTVGGVVSVYQKRILPLTTCAPRVVVGLTLWKTYGSLVSHAIKTVETVSILPDGERVTVSR
jgi:hypothetical protein